MTVREPLQIVEIDTDYCSRTYGTAPCAAALGSTGDRKCFNTFFTCQDTANFDAGTLTLRFARNQSGLPKGQTIFPALQSVSTSPTKINPGGKDSDMSALGKRARVTVKLKDFAYSDTYTDKYQAGRVDGTAQTGVGYDPQARGTFFGKLRRRWPYYNGRALRVLEGYVGDSLASMRTRHWVITEWAGPDADGNVTITAKDVLDLADNEKALCPAPSQGKLGAAMAASGLPAFDLTPAGVGAEYAASGRASIGSEVVSFTRATDTVTITARGLDGTEAQTHDEGDLFQQCYRVENAPIDEVAADLFVAYARIPSGVIPTTEWAAEVGRWLAGIRVTTTIPKPTGVSKLVSELSLLGVTFWPDVFANEVKLRANRPLDIGETAPEITDTRHILEGSTEIGDLHDQRASQVLLWHGIVDATGGEASGDNFARQARAVDLEAEGTNEYGERRVKEYFTRWLGAGNDGAALAVVSRLLSRYRDTPREVAFALDISANASVDLAALITVTSRVLQDDTGASLPTQAQVTSIEEVVPGHKLAVTAETFEFAGRFGFITENSRGDYAAASAAEIAKGTYIVGGTLTFGDGTGPYVIF